MMLQKQTITPIIAKALMFSISDNQGLEAMFEKSQKQLEAGDYVAEDEVYAQLEARIKTKLQGIAK